MFKHALGVSLTLFVFAMFLVPCKAIGGQDIAGWNRTLFNTSLEGSSLWRKVCFSIMGSSGSLFDCFVEFPDTANGTISPINFSLPLFSTAENFSISDFRVSVDYTQVG